MKAIPDERPSSPSMKLMLLIIPTIQKTVNATATAPSKTILLSPKGFAMNPMLIPRTTANSARPI